MISIVDLMSLTIKQKDNAKSAIKIVKNALGNFIINVSNVIHQKLILSIDVFKIAHYNIFLL